MAILKIYERAKHTSTDINRSFWAQQTAQLPALASNHPSYTNFITAVLRNIAENPDIKHATYLICVPEDEPGVYEVSGKSSHTDRWFVPLNVPQKSSFLQRSSFLQLLSHNIIMKDTSERYIDQSLTLDNKNFFVRVFQTSLTKYGTQHILVLTCSADSSQATQPSDDDKQAAFEYLNIFAYIATSMYLSKAEVIKFTRRQNTAWVK